jgi:hypothetical protein
MAKALNVSALGLRVPEEMMRFVAAVFSGVKAFPISRSRIDALVSQTRYPADKLKIVLMYQLTRIVKETIAEVFFDDGDVR